MQKNVFVSIVGRTNAGKSSLLNSILGEQIAVVTNKPQTTRTKITGILTRNDCQYVFIDTPGLHKAKNKLSQHMLKAADEAAGANELLLFVADSSRKPSDEEKQFLQRFKNRKVFLILNKIDLLDKEKLLSVIEQYAALFDFAEVFPVSVLKGDGIELIMQSIDREAQEGPHFFPEDSLTDQPERVLASEMIRGALLSLLSEEVPHGIAVTVESMKERITTSGEDILDIDANIFCERDSHKGIVIGKGGSMLKAAGAHARTALEDFFRIKVNLQLWVKVRPDWRNKEGSIHNFGLS